MLWSSEVICSKKELASWEEKREDVGGAVAGGVTMKGVMGVGGEGVALLRCCSPGLSSRLTIPPDWLVRDDRWLGGAGGGRLSGSVESGKV